MIYHTVIKCIVITDTCTADCNPLYNDIQYDVYSEIDYQLNEGIIMNLCLVDMIYHTVIKCIVITDMVCTADCNPLYNDIQYDVCCEPGNLGKFIKVVIANVYRRYIVCPKVLPDWCN